MAPRLSWLSECKVSQLKALCFATGLNVSGPKQALCERLRQTLPQTKLPPPTAIAGNNGHAHTHTHTHAHAQSRYSILSLDMGVRNLGLCRVDLPPDWNSSSRTIRAAPIITDWARIAISEKGGSGSGNSSVEEEEKEKFDPLTFARHAYGLTKTLLLDSTSSPPPSLILIERQRFRSASSPHVFEWTIRVNMLEAMLYAVLRTLAEQGLWAGHVQPVPPDKVSHFALDNDKASLAQQQSGKAKAKAKAKTKTKTKSDTSKRIKLVKQGLVHDWLDLPPGAGRITLEGPARITAAAYRADWPSIGKVTRGRRKNTPSSDADPPAPAPPMDKFDDLADCFLQAMTWIRWEENRRAIVEQGLRALPSTMGK